MVYRKSRRAATALVPALLLASPVAAGAPLGVAEVGEATQAAPGVTDGSEALAVRADLGGGRLLVELDATTTRALARAGAPVRVVEREEDADRPLYLVTTTPDAGALGRLGALGTVIWSDDTGALIRTTEPEIWSLAGPGVRLWRIPATPIRPAQERTGAVASAVAPEYPEIDAMLAGITGASIASFVGDLVSFPTRHSNLPGGLDAQAYLESTFAALGYTQVATLPIGGVQAKNVCATLPGAVTPGQVYVVGAHYDSTATNIANAPGADDNASGTAGVLELAKALAGMRFESTIVFCGYAGEELGLLGSAAHAGALDAAGTDVRGMINLDMIGHLADGDAIDIDVASNGASAAMRALFTDVVARYVPGSQQVNGQLPAGASSDHASFWQYGWPALMLFEDTGSYSPYIHTASDTVGVSFNSPDLAQRITRSAAAMLAVLAVPSASTGPDPDPPPPGDDPGDPAHEMETVHGGCACSLRGRAGTAGRSGMAPAGVALVLAAAARLATRRRELGPRAVSRGGAAARPPGP